MLSRAPPPNNYFEWAGVVLAVALGVVFFLSQK